MSDKAYAYVNGNNAEIYLPPGITAAVKVRTNSHLTQKVALTRNDGTVDHVFSGTGEHNTQIGTATVEGGESVLAATFEYSSDDGAFKPSRLNSGGPYEIGTYNLLVIVAENGDDADYNDAILEFSWYTPRA
ncbi:fucose-binding lectin II [Kitasatospora sp. NPDC008115]|uniref:fucose-binding lectin II n=1 Tax=Kitasatospora sp. NPDC008115 TaxID=3364022 RepID=UPI0036EBBE9C